MKESMKESMWRVFAVLALLAMPVAAVAQAQSGADRTAFERIISEQIDAFRADDGVRAYSYASPAIQQIFPTPEQFMAMVRNGYQPVYRPQSFRFGEAGTDQAGRPIQRVNILGPDGQSYEAVYTMERQPDGTWKINGCALVKLPGLST